MSFVAVCLLAPCVLSAQEFRGSFSGSVTDQQGAAIPGVKILATETRTGAKSTAVSEVTGNYEIPFLAPGEYEIGAEITGFKRFLRKGLALSAGEHPVIDIHLEIGAVTDSVTVTADAPLIVASNASVGQTVTTQEVEDLPVNGRTPITLAVMALGVIATAEPGPVRPFDNGGASSFSISGMAGNEMLLNGAPNGGNGQSLAYSPPQDAVMEVRVNTFESDAAYGHTSGGTANQITRGGTNSLHGSAYEFNQSSVLDANSFFGNKAGAARPPYHYNQWGVTSGGPVLIPKVFNGRNRVFWFFAYEGLKDADPSNSPIETANPIDFLTVPTPAERTGDFSALLSQPLNKGTTPYTIYNPYSGVASGSQVARTPFPNNIIPASMLNPIALKYFQYFPQPNIAGRADGLANFYVTAVNSDGYDNELGRLDINLSDRNKLSFDARHNYRVQDENNYLGNIASGSYLVRINEGTSLDDVYTISPSLVTDVRLNWTRYLQSTGGPNQGYDPTTLGFPSYIAQNAQALQMPAVTFTNTTVSAGTTTSFYALGGAATPASNAYDSYQIFGTVIKMHGNQAIKFGADLRDYRASAASFGNSTGSYTFTSSWTNGPLSNAAASPLGQDLAAFELGLPSSGSYGVNAQSTISSRYYALFVEDDWRVKSNLTLNLGLRWEHETPTSERFNRTTDGFNPTAVNPISVAAAAAYAKSPIAQVPISQFQALGGLTFADASHPNIYSNDSRIFSPRFGVSWVPTALGGGTVLRGGFGVFVNPIGLIGLNQSGFSQTTQLTTTLDNYLTPITTLSNPFPNGILAPTGASLGAGTNLGQAVSYTNPHVRNSYSMRWNFGIQRQLPGQFVLEVAYIGNHAVRLPLSHQLDYVPRQFLSTSPVRDQNTINLLTGGVTNPFKGLLPNASSLNGSTVALQQLLTPFPEFPINGVTMGADSNGSSYYGSMNVRLQKRLTHSLTIINNFIWNRLTERASYLNVSDPMPEKRIGSASRPLRDVLAGSYELPIGRGKRLDLGSRVANSLLGGWAVNGNLTFQSGPPISWGNVIYYGGPLSLNAHQPNGSAFDITRFNTASAQQLANNIVTFDTYYNNLRRDPTENLDASLLKRFALGEQKYLQIRFETFNTTNRVTFGAPSVTPTSSAFGQIGSTANTPRRVQIGARLVW